MEAKVEEQSSGREASDTPREFDAMTDTDISADDGFQSESLALSDTEDGAIKRSPSFTDKSIINEDKAPDVGMLNEPSVQQREQFQKRYEDKAPKMLLKKIKKKSLNSRGDLLDAIPQVLYGLEKIVKDDFTPAFTSKKQSPWNFTPLLFVFWLLGALIRYLILFPLRVVFFTVSLVMVVLLTYLASIVIPSPKMQKAVQTKILKLLIHSWMVQMGAIVQYHGFTKQSFKNTVIVSNHSNLLDVVFIYNKILCSVIGQRHGGLIGVIEKKILNPLDPIWFDRGERKDRALTLQKIKKHLETKDTPILVFPEGTCSATGYCVMFKKGVFELGAKIIPVAIKYRNIFLDPFWNSKKESFPMYIARVFKSWGIVLDVYFLEPQFQEPDESPEEFANRVREMIAKKAGLKIVDWDGFLKYVQPSQRFKDRIKKAMGIYLKRRFMDEKYRSRRKGIDQ